MEILTRIADQIEQTTSQKHDTHPFWMFEPWDVKKRPDWVKERAAEDGINLYDPEFVNIFGADPKPFQSGYMLSKKTLRFVIAGSQVGKSINGLIETFIMISGEIPYAFRYAKGVDTGIKRVISPENIIRFGRRDSSTGKVIDRNINARQAQTWQEWDCGNIKGAGLYPQEKIPEAGKQIWIGTVAESIKKYWWPKLANPDSRVLPIEFIDTSKGNKGFNTSQNIVHGIRGITIFILSFEQGHVKFESEKAHIYMGDEETPTNELFASAREHAKYTSIFMTPLKGITWSKDVVFNPEINADRFHAIQYDSPYQDKDEIESRRSSYQVWIRQSRIYGFYSEQTGEPYFDRAKINIWMQRYGMRYDLVQFQPSGQWFRMKGDKRISPLPGLIDTEVRKHPAAKENDGTTAWRMYEDRLPGVGYALSADPAEGSEDPKDSGNVNAAGIMRLPIGKELYPKMVCTIRSTLPTKAFAKLCAYALRYYNNALLAAESGIGAENKAFELEVEDWPHWYMSTVTRDSTGAPRKKRGFVMKSNQRDAIFKGIEDYLNEFDSDEYPEIPDLPLLKELAAAICGKKGRCDHTKRGSLDSAIWYGILLHVIKHDPDQIKCNVRQDAKRRERNRQPKTSPTPYGLSMLGMKEAHNG